MDFTKQGLTYIFLIIPIMFTITIIAQGIHKLKNNDPDGWVAIGFAIVFIVLIIAAYFLFLR